MVDTVDKAVRKRMMSGIRNKNTKPELIVRKVLFALGYRFRVHRRDLPGAPDIVLPGRNIAIFVHGCFWHQHAGCRFFKTPASNVDFWKQKLNKNVERDHRSVDQLRKLGWRVLVVWECSSRKNETDQLASDLVTWIESNTPTGEISEHQKSPE
jgi:DNA mismatch endonuclease (patch repair protein)